MSVDILIRCLYVEMCVLYTVPVNVAGLNGSGNCSIRPGTYDPNIAAVCRPEWSP